MTCTWWWILPWHCNNNTWQTHPFQYQTNKKRPCTGNNPVQDLWFFQSVPPSLDDGLMLHHYTYHVNRFYFAFFLPQIKYSMVRAGVRLVRLSKINTKKHRRSGADISYGRGSWTRTNACGIQNPVPYQLGDTPVLAVNDKYYSGVVASCQQFYEIFSLPKLGTGKK